MKSREGVDKLKVEGTVYEDALQQAEIMNKCFWTVLKKISEFKLNNIIGTENLMENIKVDLKEVKKLMESQDVRKAPGPDGVSNWIMKECSNQLTGKLYTYQLLRTIRMAFKYVDEEMINKLITSLIRPKLEYVADIKKLERLQRAVTKMALPEKFSL